MSEKRFRANFDVSIYDSEKEEYISVSDKGLEEIAKRMNEQQATIEQKDKQLKKAKEYFMDYLSREMSANNFSELWDLVIDDE